MFQKISQSGIKLTNCLKTADNVSSCHCVVNVSDLSAVETNAAGWLFAICSQSLLGGRDWYHSFSQILWKKAKTHFFCHVETTNFVLLFQTSVKCWGSSSQEAFQLRSSVIQLVHLMEQIWFYFSNLSCRRAASQLTSPAALHA